MEASNDQPAALKPNIYVFLTGNIIDAMVGPFKAVEGAVTYNNP